MRAGAARGAHVRPARAPRRDVPRREAPPRHPESSGPSEGTEVSRPRSAAGPIPVGPGVPGTPFDCIQGMRTPPAYAQKAKDPPHLPP